LEAINLFLLLLKIDIMPDHHNHDKGRSEVLNDFGIKVIRFTNEQILEEIDSTINQN
jgi:very-short-patch-repair endonuclease